MKWITGIVSAIVLALASSMACGGGGSGTTTTTTQSSPTVTSVSVSGNTALTAGATDQWSATARLSDGTTPSVTSTATWASNNDATASVSSSGLVTAKAAGSAEISATYQGTKGMQTVTVTAAPPPPTPLAADFTVVPDPGTGFTAALQCPVNPTPPNNNLLCKFDGTLSTAPGGITGYTWEIPAGSGNTFSGPTQMDKTIPCGKFGSAGDRDVKLTITSPSGTTSTTKKVTFVKGTPC